MLPARSLIVMILELRASAMMLMPLESFSPNVPVAWIVYSNTSEELSLAEGGVLLLPEAYVAVRFVLPTTRVSVAALVLSTMTAEMGDSLKVTVTDTLSPAFTKLF